MQAVILCGGQGTRIRDVTEDIPKPMIPIGGRPIVWHIMKIFAEYGFDHFILCLGYKSWAIKEYFLTYREHLSDFTIRLSDEHTPTFLTADPARLPDGLAGELRARLPVIEPA